MKKVIAKILFILLVSLSAKGQDILCYKDNFVEIKGFLNTIDSSIIVQIKNVSDSTLVFNSNEPYYQKIREIYAADISLIREGVNISQPGSGTFMYFKMLLPQSTYTITLRKNQCETDLESFHLLLDIQYLVLSKNVSMINGIINRELKNLVQKKKLTLKKLPLNLKLLSTPVNNNDCIKIIVG